MTQNMIACAFCVHFHSTVRDGAFCDAYPDGDGIPQDIRRGASGHLKSRPGDHGVIFSPQPGFEGMIEDLYAPIDFGGVVVDPDVDISLTPAQPGAPLAGTSVDPSNA